MLKNLIILPDGTEISSGSPRGDAIISASLIQAVNSGTELTLGSACSASLDVKLFAPNGELSISAGTEIQYYKVADDGARTKVGLFTIEKPTRSGTGTYKFSAYDRVSWLDMDLTDWLSALDGWPYTVKAFSTMVCAECGLTLKTETFLNDSYLIQKFTASGITGRQIMKWVGEICCRFIRANTEGEIELAWYEDKGVNIASSGDYAYFSGGLSYEDYEVSEIQKVQIQVSDDDVGTIYPDDEDATNAYKITGNYLLTASSADDLKGVAQNIYETLQGVIYTPCKVSIRATTAVCAGDIVHITDKNGTSITAYVMEKTQSGQKDTLECTGSARRDSVTATNEQSYTALNGKMLEIKKSVDGLKVTNADTAGRVSTLEQTAGKVSVEVADEDGVLATYIDSSNWKATYTDSEGNEISGLHFDFENKRFVINATGRFVGLDSGNYMEIAGDSLILYDTNGLPVAELGYRELSKIPGLGHSAYLKLNAIEGGSGIFAASVIVQFSNGVWIGNDEYTFGALFGNFSPTENSNGIFISNSTGMVTLYHGTDGQDLYSGEAVAKFG